jgi:predicted ester cyclase
MIIKNVTKSQLYATLNLINEKYDNNVDFNRFEQLSETRFRVTLRVKDSKKAGHRLGFSVTSKGNHRRLTSACWHVHGDFFEQLLYINSNAVIRTASGIIDKNGGNWIDRNIGSLMNPLMYSEACECGA